MLIARKEKSTLGYLGSPYNHEQKEIMDARVIANAKLVSTFMKGGKHLFSPLVHNDPLLTHYDPGRGWEQWRDYDLNFLERCDYLLVYKLRGWEHSVGLAGEIEFATANNIPIQYYEDHICDLDYFHLKLTLLKER